YWALKVNENGEKIWDKAFGNISCTLNSIALSEDGGYLLGGTTNSENPVPDKSQPSKGKSDYWIIWVDGKGTKIWDQTFGGSDYDNFNTLIMAQDGGFLLGGSSASNMSGDKSQNSRGDYDYWLIKIDKNGNKLWDKTYGGTGDERLSSITLTADNGYILSGKSNSSISGEKSEKRKGSTDYWIVKIDFNGNKIWDKTFGGDSYSNNSFSNLVNTIVVPDGFILAGSSSSKKNNDKTENSFGGFDYWIVKIDFNGNKIWDKTIGGNENDVLSQITQYDDGFLLAGSSFSDKSFYKSQNRIGVEDYWIVNVDLDGNFIWDKTIGAGLNYNSNDLQALNTTPDGGYLLGGSSNSDKSGDKTEDSKGFTDFWIVKLAPITDTDIVNFTFNIEDERVTIDAQLNEVKVWLQNDFNILSPNITIKPGSMIDPPSGSPQDFSNPVKYTVTASDGSVEEWTVNVIPPTNTFEAHINFQNEMTAAPFDYMIDSGMAYGEKGNQYSYGWLNAENRQPLNLSVNIRNREFNNLSLLQNTLIHMQYKDVGQNNGIEQEGIWEIKLPNGDYRVTAYIGDGGVDDPGTTPRHSINIEGEPLIKAFMPKGIAGAMSRFSSSSGTFHVSDGKLTVDASGGFNTKINAIDVIATDLFPIIKNQELYVFEKQEAGTSVGTVAVDNFKNSDLTFSINKHYDIPFSINERSGEIRTTETLYEYLYSSYNLEVSVSDGAKVSTAIVSVNISPLWEGGSEIINFTTLSNAGGDAGAPFNGISGWLSAKDLTPLDLSLNTRNRNIPGLDTLKNTFIHMQYGDINGVNGVNKEGIWEKKVPNGVYQVKVGVGDGSIDKPNEMPRHTINIEGKNAINSFIPTGVKGAATRFTEGKVYVKISDTKLTMDAFGGFNTKVDYIKITPYDEREEAPLITWDKAIGGSQKDTLTTMVATPDGGYLLGGISNSSISSEKSGNSKGKSDYWIVKTDANGNKLWDKTYGGYKDDNLYSIALTPDGGYLLAGLSASRISGDKEVVFSEEDEGEKDYWVLKVNKNGNKVWEQAYYSTSADPYYNRSGDNYFQTSVLNVSGGGYLLGGTYRYNFRVIKIDEEGTIIWDKNIEDYNIHNLHTMVNTADGGYLLGGSTADLDRRHTDYWLVKLDTSGNISWQKQIEADELDILTSVVATVDGGYLIGGYSGSGQTLAKTEDRLGGFDYWILKLDSLGNILWDRAYGGRNDDLLSSIKQTNDGGFLLGGTSSSMMSTYKSQDSVGDDYWILKINETGDVLWDKTVSAAGNDIFSTLLPKDDGGFILGGYSDSNSSGDKTEESRGEYDFWILSTTKPVSDTDITSFVLEDQSNEAVIDSGVATIYIEVSNNANITSLVPTIELKSAGSSIEPESGIAQDFTNPVIYTVTTAEGRQQEWTVQVNKMDNSDFQVQINFQDEATAAPDHSLIDTGKTFGLKQSGYKYGWLTKNHQSLDLSKDARNRKYADLDVTKNTLIHMQYNDVGNKANGVTKEGIWEIDVPNGEYDVKVTVGDGAIDQPQHLPKHTINAEGINIINSFIPAGALGSLSRFMTATATVSVLDGKLTIDARGGFNTKIDYLSIKSTSLNNESIIKTLQKTNLSLSVIKKENYLMYPNPASSYVNIQRADPFMNIENILIQDLRGSTIQAYDPSTIKNALGYVIPIDQLQSGLYIISVAQDNGSVDQLKLVVKH
ncbi:MAG: T9SS type A sorting domain-containing protein, partial [Leeuwenhoekiella sp.]